MLFCCLFWKKFIPLFNTSCKRLKILFIHSVSLNHHHHHHHPPPHHHQRIYQDDIITNIITIIITIINIYQDDINIIITCKLLVLITFLPNKFHCYNVFYYFDNNYFLTLWMDKMIVQYH